MLSAKDERRTGGTRIWWAALCLWLALSLLGAVALWHMRRDALAGQARELDLLSHALADEVERGLQDVEQGLRAFRTELAEGRVPLQGAAGTQALRTRADLLPLVTSLWLVDGAGAVVAASDAEPAPALSSFAPALVPGGTAIAISAPFARKGTAPRVAVGLPLEAGAGRPGGWIVAAIPATALLGAFSAATPTADAHMAVFRADGTPLAGNAVPPRVQAESSSRTLGHYGMTMVLARDREAVLAPWRQAAQLAATVMALLLAVTAVAVQLVLRANRRRAEAQQALALQRSRATRLEALGTLAGGVAHDFNNILAAIVGFGEMAQEAAPQGSDQALQLDRVIQAATRGRGLVQRLLGSRRGGSRAPSVFELEPIVEEALGVLSATLRPGVVIERVFEAPGARLQGDPTQIFEAVMNLCTNALQAMPDGGRLSVRLHRLLATAPRVLSHSELAAGRYLVLAVSDQGRGITPDVMEHLFEPFFTTRSADAGTGLGLAVVHGVVADAGGAIDVQSAPGQGARFTVYLHEFGAG
jgi:signal transduction histidine kinase